MLKNLKQIDWKKLNDESRHSNMLLRNWRNGYREVPALLREVADGEDNEDLFAGLFGEMDHDIDGKLFEIVLPFLWKIVIKGDEEAVNLALELIEQGYMCFYSMEKESIDLQIHLQGISKLPANLLGNDAAAAFAKLKELARMADEDEVETYSPAINILSFIPDYHTETIALFQSLLGQGSSTKDEVLLSALGRLLYRYKLPITNDFEKYLDKSGSAIQTMAASWIMQIAPSQANDYTQSLHIHRDLMLSDGFDANLQSWYWLDYQD